MRKNTLFFLSTLVIISALCAFCAPSHAYAAQCDNGQDDDSDGKIDYEGFGAAPKDPDCSSDEDDSEKATTTESETTDTGVGVTNLGFAITNPLDSDIDTLPEFINRVVEIFLMIATPIVALMIIYAGFLFVVARGNPEAIEKAKKTLGYTLLGAAILLGAFVISTAIQDTIMSISKEGTTDTP